MKLFKLVRLFAVFGMMALFAPLWSLTQMVAVQIDVQQPTLSPDGQNRARVLATDLESVFMDNLFDAGHISFNAPAEIILAKSEQAPSLVENLLVQTKAGGASLLILCRLSLSEPVPNQALAISTVSISAIPIYSARDFPVTWTIPLTKGSSDAEFRASLKTVASMLVAKIDSLPREVARLGRGD